jgi:hypothetical protein
VHGQLVEQQELTPSPAEADRIDGVIAAEQHQLYSVTALVPLKGIDVLANKRYRVQLNAFMKGKGDLSYSYSCKDKKFSRNSVDLYEVGVVYSPDSCYVYSTLT